MLDKLRDGAISTIHKYYTNSPDIPTLYMLVIAINILLQTLYYVDKSASKVYTSADTVSSLIPIYNDLAGRIVKVRNLICHCMGTRYCAEQCELLLEDWHKVRDLLDYLGVLDNLASDTFESYFEKVGITELSDKQEEYARLCALYNTTDINELSTHIKEDLL